MGGYPAGPDLSKAGPPVLLATLPPIPGDPKALELQSFTTSTGVADLYLGQAVGSDLLVHHYVHKAPGWTFKYDKVQRRKGGGHGSNISRGTKLIWQSWPVGGQDVVRLKWAAGSASKDDGETMRVGTDWFATPALDVAHNLLLLRVVHAGHETYRVFKLSEISHAKAAPAPLGQLDDWAEDRWGPFQGCAIYGRHIYIASGGTTGAADWAKKNQQHTVLVTCFDWTTGKSAGQLNVTRHGLVAGDPAMSSELEDLEVLVVDEGSGPKVWLVGAFKVGSGSGPTARRVRLVLIAPAADP